jgi:hypothetical protein
MQGSRGFIVSTEWFVKTVVQGLIDNVRIWLDSDCERNQEDRDNEGVQNHH